MDLRLLNKINELAQKFEEHEGESLIKGAKLMADAIEQDRLIYIFGGGGHTTLVMQEMFWRAGGLANLSPMLDLSIHPVTPAYMYLFHERMHGIGDSIVDYYGVGKDDVVLIFHSYGFNPPTIDCALEAKKRGAHTIGISSKDWDRNTPKDFHIRHKSGKHLSDIVEVYLDDYVPYMDTVIKVEGLEQPVTGVSSTIDFYIAHRLEMECVKECVNRGIDPPIWSSANIPGGDEKNNKLRDKYNNRVKLL
ncbi:MAG: sugar isomerase domain-containing protein [Bacteroidota bacterium]